MLAELPLLATHCTRCVVSSAPTHHDEGADLLVAAAQSAFIGRAAGLHFGHQHALLDRAGLWVRCSRGSIRGPCRHDP